MRLILALLLALAPSLPAAAAPLIIAHRGASGERPEHTLAAYERAVDAGADYIEPDLVVTKDLVLVARHETEIGGTTDVATRSEFAARQRTKTVDGMLMTGWFVEDFTLPELRTLRARERIPGVRPANARYDGLWQIPTFAEIAKLVRAKEAETGRRIGLYPELKHSTFLLQNAGIDGVDLLVAALKAEGLNAPGTPLFVQSFEVEPLRRLHKLLPDVALVQLIAAEGGPADSPALRYETMIQPAGLAEIASYAAAIGPDVRLLSDGPGGLGGSGGSGGLIAAAHAARLKVHAWTLRKENVFLPAQFRRGTAPNQAGDVAGLAGQLAAAGVDGLFTDDPALIVPAVVPAGIPAGR